MTPRLSSYEQFWPYYLSQHSKAATRLLHLLGTSAGLLCLALALAGGSLALVALGFVLGYAGAWIGHFAVERNRPATFDYPLWSFRADFRMYRLMLAGRLGPELARAAELYAPAGLNAGRAS